MEGVTDPVMDARFGHAGVDRLAAVLRIFCFGIPLPRRGTAIATAPSQSWYCGMRFKSAAECWRTHNR
jgi:hypothetical protein